MHRQLARRREFRHKLLVRSSSTVFASVMIVGTVLFPSLWWLAFWAVAIAFVNWRQWLVFVSKDGFVCDLCRKMKAGKHLAPVGSIPVSPSMGRVLVCCDACAERLRENFSLIEESKKAAASHVPPPPRRYVSSLAPQGSREFRPSGIVVGS